MSRDCHPPLFGIKNFTQPHMNRQKRFHEIVHFRKDIRKKFTKNMCLYGRLLRQHDDGVLLTIGTR